MRHVRRLNPLVSSLDESSLPQFAARNVLFELLLPQQQFRPIVQNDVHAPSN